MARFKHYYKQERTRQIACAKRVVALVCLCVCLVMVRAEILMDGFVLDTAQIYDIPEVEVVERHARSEVRSVAPMQVLSAEKMEQLNVLQIADAAKHFSGVSVKDYGGIGGLKTISVRSLGAAHTAVSLDGVTLSDMQTGQIDIGRFSLDNVELLTLSNGQSDQIFQPARQFASASVLTVRTKKPEFDDTWLMGRVAYKGGSFGLINPCLNMAFRLHRQWSLAVSGEYMGAHGKYPYVLDYGVAGVDSMSNEVRENSDVMNVRAEVSVHGEFAHNSKLHFKCYYYGSDRGLPGATIFYNTQNFSSQRTADRTVFAQAHYATDFSPVVSFQANAKYNHGWMHYLDPTTLNSAGREEYEYVQQEGYLSASVLYRAFPFLSFSLATDGVVNMLDGAREVFSRPVRYSSYTSLAARYVHECVTATASVVATHVSDRVGEGEAADAYTRLSPYAGVSVLPFGGVDLRLRAFYKNVFRMPTFNDLYYGAVGNADLRPETTHQFNVGATYIDNFGIIVPSLSFTVDAYHNRVQNKIVAYPTKNIFLWSMQNYGRVAITGVDVAGEVTLAPLDELHLVVGASYTYMRALNVTDPEGRDYKHQIPYTPRVSGSGKATVVTPWVDVAYTVVWSGHRYSAAQNYVENRVEGYADHSIALRHDMRWGRYGLDLAVECLNVTNENYAVVRYFPMPGRSWRATVVFSF